MQFILKGLRMRTEGMMRRVVVGADAEAGAVAVGASLAELRVSWSKARAKARAEAEAVPRIRAEARIQDRHLQPPAEAVRPDR